MSSPSSIYQNGLKYYDNRDPLPIEPDIQEFIIKNFESHNKVEWENDTTRDLFILFDVIDVEVEGETIQELSWKKYVLE